MSFRFRLEALLRLKRSLERQQELLLAAAHQQVAVLERQAHAIRAARASLLNSRNQAAAIGGMPASQLHFYENRGSLLEALEKSVNRQLEDARKLRLARSAALAAARRERELPESLRNRQLREYRQQESRREQRQLDNLHLLLLNAQRRRS